MNSSPSLYITFFITLSFNYVNSETFRKKNIVLIITDDQDIELGSMMYMPKTLKLMKDKGTEFSGGFVTTPICCPSRSSILSGLYVHNHNVHTNNQNCSGSEWRSIHESRSIGVYLKKAGYRTSYLGKYLNEYEGNYTPRGWDYWLGLVKNSKFYNYTVNMNGEKLRYGSNYEKDYFTDLIINRSLEFISDHIRNRPWQPFLSVLSYPAPHGPEDPAPQYSKLFPFIDSHRTEAWNYAPNPDKQWLLQRTGKMEPVHVAFTDILHRRRMQTLQSVDEAVNRLFSLLRDYNQLSNTYVLYTSDHGYHLGQFGLIKGKNMPYEFDIRVPFFLRGPGVPKNVTIRRPVSNLDIGPTLIDVAGVKVPEHMDGRSLLELISIHKGAHQAYNLAPWRDTVLIERGKMPKLKRIRDRWLKQKERYSKEMRLNKECSKEEWHGQCLHGQSWKCHRSVDGRWRIYKCRHSQDNYHCSCPEHPRSKRDFSPAFGDDNDQDLLIDEFLLDSYQRNILNDRHWYQGSFHDDKGNRSKRSPLCSCKNNATHHPLKRVEFPIMDRIFFTYGFQGEGSRKKKEKTNSSDASRTCSVPQMNCFSHGYNHWRTPPLWPSDYGEFCFCQNSNNNTYWCLRTLNSTHNFLYCEFVTEFISYYNLNEDPFQLTNIVYSLEIPLLEELSERLRLLRECKGKQCEQYAGTEWRHYAQLNRT